MDLGVRYLMRETYFSSLDMAQNTLEALGLSRAEAQESIRRFDEHDRKMLHQQREAGDDEQKLIQSVQHAAKELEGLFEADVTRAESRPSRRRIRRPLEWSERKLSASGSRWPSRSAARAASAR